MLDLSIIVPVYNMAPNGDLEYCLDSLVNQTLENIEIIAVDDASTDNSLEILRRYEAKYPGRFKAVASPENRKQGGARNLGLKQAKGRFIGFMDADDWVLPDTFEKMLRKADETGADVVGTNLCLIYEHTMIPTKMHESYSLDMVGVLDHERRKKLVFQSGPISTKIYDRSIFFDKEINFPEKMFYEDNAVSIELVMRMKHFELVNEPNVFYYQRANSTTHSFDFNKMLNRLDAMRIMLGYAKSNGALEEFNEEIEFNYTNLFYRNTLFSYMQSDIKKDEKFITQMRDELLREFPDFRDNPYYNQYVNEYEQKLINTQLKSTKRFLFIYKLKQISKKIRRR